MDFSPLYEQHLKNVLAQDNQEDNTAKKEPKTLSLEEKIKKLQKMRM